LTRKSLLKMNYILNETKRDIIHIENDKDVFKSIRVAIEERGWSLFDKVHFFTDDDCVDVVDLLLNNNYTIDRPFDD
jgi:hypothetical protein